MKGVIQSARGGRPSKVTKLAGTPRGRPGRRVGVSDAHGLSNSDLADLDQDANADEDHEHNPHTSFDHDAAAIAAAAAAQHHHHQQQQQEHQQQLDLTAASILASSVHTANDQHPDLGGTHMDDGSHVPTVEELARQSGYAEFVVESALAKRLAGEPGVRLAQQRRPEQQLNLSRRSNVEALFAHIAGEEVPNCKNCKKGHGPWTACVVIEGQMCQSCSNCWFNASGSRCSLHESRPQGQQGVQMLGNESIAFPVPTAPPAAMAPFNFAAPASADPVVRYTVEQAMALVRGADKKARSMLMIEATARQLAFQIAQYEEAIEDEQNQAQANAQDANQPVLNDQGAP
ncbi:uncharacterized protein GGS22DRAFT_171244 [Annulohypoxylon maeteangense]|uniref:uncharacterized protein n=1 Tax=Annulohypoxylon maeteangense TaxID=1927788 RepID=UPI002008B1D1|nr:uncharacterized protein GGS22DRAFT_171244 [Annulohypoxylon maeteangense]KAI0881969.1 hypothetical protein GGS22DRAFT_171244 [Annulohypoxylon maeteangense]